MLECRQLLIPARADFLEHVHVVFSHHFGWWTSWNFGAIPLLVDQATCHLQSSNLNLLEHLSRRLDDSFNVLNIFLSRCEELNMSENLTTNIRRLLEGLHSIHTRIFIIIINEHDFVLNSNHPCFVPSAEPTYTGLGRSRQRVWAAEINRLYDVYRSWKDVALHLGVSVRTLERKRNEFNITVSGRTGSRSTYTTISDEQLCSVVREVLEIIPETSEAYNIGACRQRNIFVQRQRIRDAINNTDPVSRALPGSICIMHMYVCM